MFRACGFGWFLVGALLVVPAVVCADDDNSCIECHSADIWEGDQKSFHVSAETLASDIHWAKGIRCADCHGGDPTSLDTNEAHAVENGFRKADSPADVVTFCGHCHSDAEYMKKFNPDAPTDIVAKYLQSGHAAHKTRKGETETVRCTACHTTHAIRAVSDPESLVHPSKFNRTCVQCHEGQGKGVLASVHGGGSSPADGAQSLVQCTSCHTGDAHAFPQNPKTNPSFIRQQVTACGACHGEDRDEYLRSVHGDGLMKAGLVSTAVCSNCHGAHMVLPASNPKSKLHEDRVAATCAQCHRFIEERLMKSVHGRKPDDGEHHGDDEGSSRRKPTCIDCHKGHDLPDPESVGFRVSLPDRCGHCHESFSTGYGMSMHGELSNLGYGPAANCSDCHGDHNILPASDDKSQVAEANLPQTCGKCHPGATASFVRFDPHADHRDFDRNPLLFYVYYGFVTLICAIFGVFGMHSLLWLIRGTVDFARNGRPAMLKPRCVAYSRFGAFHRIGHTIMMVSFLGLALTGLPLKYSEQPWAQQLALSLGGFGSMGLWHRLFALTTFGCFGTYVLFLASRYFVARRRGVPRMVILFGPDSMLPSFRDFVEFFGMIRWFVGLGPKPKFERWAYWEKFDFFGATSDVILIGTTGLILWFPQLFCQFLPGEGLNVAKVIHSTLALLATGFVFAVHFFNTHFRPDKIPMDMSILTGTISEEEMEHERPQWFERLKAGGALDEMRTTAPTRAGLWLLRLAGGLALVIGLALLVGILTTTLRR